MKNLKLIGGLAALSFLGITNVYAQDCSSLQARIDEAADGSIVNAITCDGNLNIKNNITLDLYGNTINTSNITVAGELTLKDSVGNGKINGTTQGSKALINVKGKMTMESGTITTNGHAILANGGSVIINGGSVTAQWCALSGNNTLGTMVFEVNGGTLKSTEDIAVYMPGPISYTMKGGHIIGGLQFRMGEINISGGIIEATIGELSDIKTVYKSSGSKNYPDAISVIGGTYETKHGANDLNLNITGGTFKTNRKGRAVAIYDYAKVKQNKNINISGGNFETDGDNVYSVLSVEDLGINSPVEGYNNPEYVGKVNTTIVGGKFNRDVTSFLGEDYIQADGVVLKKQVEPITPEEPSESSDEASITVTSPTVDTKNEVKELVVGLADVSNAQMTFTKALEKLNIDTTNKNITIDVKHSNLKEENINKNELDSMVSTLKKSQPNAKILEYFDLSLNVMDAVSNVQLGQLSELDSKVKFNIALPDDMIGAQEGFTRTYYIIRFHDNKSEILSANLNKDKKSITFETDKFSSYALAYVDTKEETVVPKTFDGIISYLVIGVVTILSILGLTKYVKKHN